MRPKWLLLIPLFLLVVLPTSCSRSRGGGAAAQLVALVSALVYKGAVTAPADVAIYEVRTTGARGRKLGEAQTDNGTVEVEILDYEGPIAFEVTGGQFRDFTGATSSIPIDTPMLGLGWADRSRTTSYTVSPLSHFIYCVMEAYAQDPDTPVKTAMWNAEVDIARLIGSPGSSILTAGINDPGTTQAPGLETDYGISVAALCELAIDTNRDFMELVTAMGLDLKDRKADGRFCGQPILDSSGNPLELDIWNVGLVAAVLDFLSSPFNQTGLSSSPVVGGFQNFDFPEQPFIRTIRNPTVWFGSFTSQIDVLGNFDTANGLDVTVGGFQVDRARLSPIGMAQGFSFTVDESSIPSIFGSGTKASLQIEDSTTRYRSYFKDAISLVDLLARPTIDKVQLTTVPTGGGAHSWIRGSNFHLGTQFFFDMQPAPVVSVRPDGRAALVSVPPGEPGPADVEARNGSDFSVLSAAVRYADFEVALGYTPTDLGPEINVGYRWMVDDTDGLKVDLWSNIANYINEDFGEIALHRSLTASEANPTPSQGSISNAAAIRNRAGVTGRLRFEESASNFNLGLRYVERNGTRYGQSGDGFYASFDQPTGFGLSDLGRYYFFKTVQWNFGTSQYREVTGSGEFGEDGIASFNGESRTMNWNDGSLVKGDYVASYGFQVGSDGRFALTPLRGGMTVDLTGYFNESGKNFYYGGTKGDWITASFGGSYRGGRSNESLVGYRQGARISTAIEDNGGFEARLGYDWQVGNFSLGGDLVTRLQIAQGFAQAESDAEARFKTGTTVGLRYVSPAGVIRDQDDELDGYVSVGIKYDFGWGDVGVNVPVPGLVTKDTLRGPYLGVGQGFGYLGQTSPGSMSEVYQSALFRTEFQPDNVPQVEGSPFTLAGTKTSAFDLKTTTRLGTSVTSEILANQTTNDQVIYTGNYDKAWAIATVIDPTGPLAGKMAPFVLGSAHVSWDGQDGVFNGVGAGDIAGTEYFARALPPEIGLSGHYHLAGLRNRYDGTTAEKFSSILQGGAGGTGFNFQLMGSFDYSGTFREIGETGTDQTSTFSESEGSAGIDQNGFLSLSIGGRDWRGLVSPNLEYLRVLDWTEDTEHGDLYGIQFSEVRPPDVASTFEGIAVDFGDHPRHETTQIWSLHTGHRQNQFSYIGDNFTHDNVDPYVEFDDNLSLFSQVTFADGFVRATLIPRPTEPLITLEGAASPSARYGMLQATQPGAYILGVRLRF